MLPWAQTADFSMLSHILDVTLSQCRAPLTAASLLSAFCLIRMIEELDLWWKCDNLSCSSALLKDCSKHFLSMTVWLHKSLQIFTELVRYLLYVQNAAVCLTLNAFISGVCPLSSVWCRKSTDIILHLKSNCKASQCLSEPSLVQDEL